MTTERSGIGSMLHRFVRRGRLIVVGGVEWRYRVGRGSVIAYSITGERRCEDAWRVKELDQPDTLDRGRWKRTSDGMVQPRDVARWLNAPNVEVCHGANDQKGNGNECKQ